jgi:hypothetical protein
MCWRWPDNTQLIGWFGNACNLLKLYLFHYYISLTNGTRGRARIAGVGGMSFN